MKKLIFLLFITSCFNKGLPSRDLYKALPEDNIQDISLDEAKVNYKQNPNIYNLTILLELGTDIDGYINEIGDTFLTHAVDKKIDIEIIKFMLNKEADVNKKNIQGFAPLHLAIIKQDENLVNLLLNQPQIRPSMFSEREGKLYKIPLVLAQEGDNKKIVRLIHECITNKTKEQFPQRAEKLQRAREKARRMLDALQNNGEL